MSAALPWFSFAEPPAHHDIPISVPRPEYPVEARQRHLTGAGVFALHVAPSGTVTSVYVVKSTGQNVLDRAASAAFRSWRFSPGKSRVVTESITYTAKGVSY
ncbi:MAG: energy transducer TonB [Verrucomicrobia bacterium]|nr:energy transducer TonB [Verrucomicrobiota bacterium]